MWLAGPRCAAQIFEDVSGGVVVSFDIGRAVCEGDLSSYMNQLAKANAHVLAYNLAKDATQWGLVDEMSGAVFYVLFPPWVRQKYMGTPARPPLPGGAMDLQPSAPEMMEAQHAAAEGVSGGGGLASRAGSSRVGPAMPASRHAVHAQ